MLFITTLSRNLVKSQTLRLTLLVICGVFMGYTLLPLPQPMERLFNSSHLFKFLVLYICGLGILPESDLDDHHVIILATVCFLVLAGFQALRIIK